MTQTACNMQFQDNQQTLIECQIEKMGGIENQNSDGHPPATKMNEAMEISR